MPPDDTGDPLDALLAWATARGVVLHNVRPQRIPGAGVGVVATRAIAPGEPVLQTPAAALRTLETVRPRVASRLPRALSVHGALAADLALDDDDDDRSSAATGGPGGSSSCAPWAAVCPTLADLSTVPLVWPAALQELLPGPAAELLRAQKAKFAADWGAVSAAFPVCEDGEDAHVSEGDDEERHDDKENDGHENTGTAKEQEGQESERPAKRRRKEKTHALTESRYMHAWLLVNTRTFYWVNAKLRRRGPEDHMCLQPVADLLNHGAGSADEGTQDCHVAFDVREGFTISARRAYAPGDEVRISYGAHSGDFLLAEYGFAMGGADNRWDAVTLDEVVLPRFEREPALRERLADAGFSGSYNVDMRSGACYRTQVALRLLLCAGQGPRAVGAWKRFVDSGGDDDDDGGVTQRKFDALLVELLREHRVTARGRIEAVGALGEGSGAPEQKAMLVMRWEQIVETLDVNIKKLAES